MQLSNRTQQNKMRSDSHVQPAANTGGKFSLPLQDNRPSSIVQKKQVEAMEGKVVQMRRRRRGAAAAAAVVPAAAAVVPVAPVAPAIPAHTCTGLGSYQYPRGNGHSTDHHVSFQDGTRWSIHYDLGSRRIRSITHTGGPMAIAHWGVGLNQQGMPRAQMRDWYRNNQPAALPYFQSFMARANAAGE